MSRFHIALLVVLIGWGAPSVYGATQTSVSGVVRDSAGVPQIGAVVQLLRPDMSVVASAYTNSKGHFAFNPIFPGRYAVKAMGATFLPALRENVRVSSSVVVNLTLNTLYEVMQWLPTQPRTSNEQKDDWEWTLRSAANRPLLRMLEDGPLVVVSDGPNTQPKLKARLMATGQQGTFGEDGERISVEMEDTPSNSRELLARVDFDPSTNAGMESMLGFRQELGYAGAVQSVAAVSIHPEIAGAGAVGLDEVAARSSEVMNMGDEFDVEAGAEQVLARFAQNSPNTIVAALPFLTAGWHDGNSTVRYSMATALPQTHFQDASQAASFMPAVSMRDGRLLLEHGFHQEIGWERTTDASGVSVVFYSDALSNPVLEAARRSAVGSGFINAGALLDGGSGILRAAGMGYSSAGLVASVQRRLPHGDLIRISYASGDALTMTPAQQSETLSQMVASARPHRAQMYSISLSGTLEGTGTRWRASYRLQPEQTVTRVAPYASNAADPYVSAHLRQPLRRGHESARQMDVTVDMRNLLAQGYRPFVLTDGSLLLFAQDQRSMSAGLAFTF